MKFLKIIFASFLLALPIVGFAQEAPEQTTPTETVSPLADGKIHHYINLWAGVGYSALEHKYSMDSIGTGTKVPGGAGGMIGFGYELHKNKFIFTVGPEFRIISSTTKFDDIMHAQNFQYSDDRITTTQTRYYNLQNYQQTHLLGQVTLPILFGAQFNNGLYFLAGAKLGFGLFNSYSNKSSDLQMTLTDHAAYDPTWTNMEKHNLQTTSATCEKDNTKISFGLDAAISAEIGVCLDRWLPDRVKTVGKTNLTYRLGAFVDYGILNIGPKGQGSQDLVNYNITETRRNYPELQSVSALNIYNKENNFKKSNLNSLLAGVKFTIGFELQKKEKPEPPVPNPKLFVYVVDSLSGKPLYNASKPVQCQVWDINPKGNKLLKDGKTDKNGKVYYAEIKPGNFQFKAKADGYFPKTMDWYHEQDNDTVRVQLVKEPIFALSVRNVETGDPIKARAQVENVETGKIVFESTLDSLKVKAQTKLAPGRNYMVKVKAPGYLSYAGEIDSIDGLTTVYMTPIAKGLSFTLYVYFATDKTDVLPSSEPELLKFYEFMTENPNVHVMIEGHTDNIGSDEHNMKLSDGRAKSVRQSMIDRGIDPSRMEYVGKGFHEPIDTNDTEEGRQHNRRVKVIITSN